MRRAIYGGLAPCGLWALACLVVGRATSASRIAGYLFWALYLLVYVAYASGLWRFGSVPASTGAARPARLAFVCFASAAASPCLSVLFEWLIRALSANSYRLNGLVFFLLLSIVPFALHAASLGLLVRALGAALRSQGETPPDWAPQAFGAWVVGCALLIPLSILPFFGLTSRLVIGLPVALSRAVLDLSGIALATAVWFTPGGGIAFILALASVMGRTAGALAREESPETAPC
jgi:hypothetical protein